MAKIAQGTVCKIFARYEVKPYKVRHYLERRDAAFEAKMAEVICVYREVAVMRENQSENKPPSARDHQYNRYGTLSLLAGIDLLTGQVHASIEDRHRSREFLGNFVGPVVDDRIVDASKQDIRPLHGVMGVPSRMTIKPPELAGWSGVKEIHLGSSAHRAESRLPA